MLLREGLSQQKDESCSARFRPWLVVVVVVVVAVCVLPFCLSRIASCVFVLLSMYARERNDTQVRHHPSSTATATTTATTTRQRSLELDLIRQKKKKKKKKARKVKENQG